MVKITALQLVCYKLLAAQAAINNAAVAPKRTNALGVYKEPRIQDDPYCIGDSERYLYCFFCWSLLLMAIVVVRSYSCFR